MPFKLFDFPIFDYFHSRSGFGLPIFNTLDSSSTNAEEEKSLDIENKETLIENGPRNSMLKVIPEQNEGSSTKKWEESHHPYTRPSYSSTIQTYKGPIGEWTVETRIGTFSSTSEFFGSSFEQDFGKHLFEHNSRSDLESDFFGSGSNSDNGLYSPFSEGFPYSKQGPGGLFEQVFSMMKQFQQIADSFDPDQFGMGPPRI